MLRMRTRASSSISLSLSRKQCVRNYAFSHPMRASRMHAAADDAAAVYTTYDDTRVFTDFNRNRQSIVVDDVVVKRNGERPHYACDYTFIWYTVTPACTRSINHVWSVWKTYLATTTVGRNLCVSVCLSIYRCTGTANDRCVPSNQKCTRMSAYFEKNIPHIHCRISTPSPHTWRELVSHLAQNRNQHKFGTSTAIIVQQRLVWLTYWVPCVFRSVWTVITLNTFHNYNDYVRCDIVRLPHHFQRNDNPTNRHSIRVDFEREPRIIALHLGRSEGGRRRHFYCLSRTNHHQLCGSTRSACLCVSM